MTGHGGSDLLGMELHGQGKDRTMNTAKGAPWATHGLMVLATVFVASSFAVGAAITHGLDPAALTLLRFSLAAALFAPLITYKYGLSWPTPKALASYAVLSAFLVGFFWAMFLSLRYTTALNTGALFTLLPGISSIFGAILVGERLGRHRLVAVAIGMVGALWVVFRGDPDRLFAFAFNIGDLIFLGGCVMFGIYEPLVRRLHGPAPTAVVTFWVLVTGSVWLALLLNKGIWQTDWRSVDFYVFAGIVYLEVFSTIVTFFLFQFCTMRIGPTRVLAYTFLIPALVLVIEWLAGSGLPPPMTYPGIAVVLAAMVVLQSGNRH